MILYIIEKIILIILIYHRIRIFFSNQGGVLMKKKILAALLIGALSLTGCGTDNTPSKTAQKDELTITVGRNMVAGKFDPTIGYGVWHPDIFHSHILTVGKDNKLVNDLATKETISADGLTYTYEIRKDAKFTDGKTLTAKDIVFTFNKTKERASAADLSMLDSVEAKDDYTVVFHLKKPWSTFPYSLTEIGIVPAHAYTDTYGDKPIGSGAWKVLDFKKDQQLILAPNEYYYGKKSPFKKITILKVDEDAALASAKSGQLDLVYVDAESSKTKVDHMTVLTKPTIDSFSINLPVIPETTEDGQIVGNNVTSDIAIRQALNIGINRQAIIDNALSGCGTPAFSTSPEAPWSSKYTFQDNRVEEAKKLLEDAGWKDTDGDGIRKKNGVKAEFTVTGRSNDLARYNTVVALAENAKPLGIHIIAKSEAWAEARKARHTPTCWSFVDLNPIDFYRQFHSSQIGKQVINNPSSYRNAAVDAEIDAALSSNNREDSYRHWINAQDLVEKDIPSLRISFPSLTYYVKDGLHIPEYGKTITRGQGISIIENMNEWIWDSK